MSPRSGTIHFPTPDITLKGVLTVLVVWLAYTIFYAGLIARYMGYNYFGVFEGQLVYHGFLLIGSVPAWYIALHVLDDARWRWKLLFHAVSAPLYAWGCYKGYLVTARFIYGDAISSSLTQIRFVGDWIIYGNLMLYIIQFAIYHSLRSMQRLQAKEREAAELRALARESEVAALKAQINPHFLFNTLNSISAMISKKPQEAREMIAKLAELMRFSFECYRHDRISLADELHFVETYLEIEKQRFGDRLQVVYDVAREALPERVPPMILQPLVENAVRHGIAPQEKGGCITLKIVPVFGRLTFELSDTGAGLNGKSVQEILSQGIGLKNTDARLRQIYGPDAALHISPGENHGFRLTFAIPL